MLLPQSAWKLLRFLGNEYESLQGGGLRTWCSPAKYLLNIMVCLMWDSWLDGIDLGVTFTTKGKNDHDYPSLVAHHFPIF